jgi:hypothetical protein
MFGTVRRTKSRRSVRRTKTRRSVRLSFCKNSWLGRFLICIRPDGVFLLISSNQNSHDIVIKRYRRTSDIKKKDIGDDKTIPLSRGYFTPCKSKVIFEYQTKFISLISFIVTSILQSLNTGQQSSEVPSVSTVQTD